MLLTYGPGFPMIVATIGFTKKTAEELFTPLAQGGVRTLADVRLEPISLLWSEEGPEKCHRRLVAERLARKDASVEIIHLR
ncbi:MAG: hypothetical protein ACYC5Q_03455 [Thermoleophilia bacterium]